MQTCKNFIGLMLLFIFCFTQTAISVSLKAENIYRWIYVIKPQEWYQEQADLWQQKIEKNKTDPQSWYNYFLASKYAIINNENVDQRKVLDEILNQMGKYIPESYEYAYLQYYNGIHELALIEKAYKLDQQRADAFYEFISYYELTRDMANKKIFCEKLYNSEDIAPGLLNYNYNVLMSADKNAILFTNGDNDTYPAWILQDLKNIRSDVLILNVSLTFGIRDYLKKLLAQRNIEIDVNLLSSKNIESYLNDLVLQLTTKYPEIPIHFACTINSAYIKSLNEYLYLVGLTFVYSKERIDNIAMIKNNLQINMRLDYLNHDWYNEKYMATPLIDRLNINYVIPFINLAEHLYLSGESEKAKMWKKKALILAQKIDNKRVVNFIMEKDF